MFGLWMHMRFPNAFPNFSDCFPNFSDRAKDITPAPDISYAPKPAGDARSRSLAKGFILRQTLEQNNLRRYFNGITQNRWTGITQNRWTDNSRFVSNRCGGASNVSSEPREVTARRRGGRSGAADLLCGPCAGRGVEPDCQWDRVCRGSVLYLQGPSSLRHDAHCDTRCVERRRTAIPAVRVPRQRFLRASDRRRRTGGPRRFAFAVSRPAGEAGRRACELALADSERPIQNARNSARPAERRRHPRLARRRRLGFSGRIRFFKRTRSVSNDAAIERFCVSTVVPVCEAFRA